jgi:hypothetical protein
MLFQHSVFQQLHLVRWVEVTLRLTVSKSWYRVSLWDSRPDIISCRNVVVWNLRSCFCGPPSLTRGRVFNLQCNHSMVRVTQNPRLYFTVSSETPPTWRARFPYLYPPGTRWLSYTPGHWINCVWYHLNSYQIPYSSFPWKDVFSYKRRIRSPLYLHKKEESRIPCK